MLCLRMCWHMAAFSSLDSISLYSYLREEKWCLFDLRRCVIGCFAWSVAHSLVISVALFIVQW